MLRVVSKVLFRPALLLRRGWPAASFSTARLPHPLPTSEEIRNYSDKAIRELIARANLSTEHVVEPSELQALGQVALEKLKSVSDSEAKPKAMNYALEHPFTLAIMQGLKSSAGGNNGQALVEFNRALDIAEKDGGRQSIEAAGARNEIARIHAKTGKIEQAIKLATEVVGIYERHWGTDHKMYAEAAYDLACYMALNRQPRRASELMSQCQPLLLKHLGPDHPKTKQVGAMMQMLAKSVDK